jgi:3-oxoacyl-(acyl-carrier-protein) synthase
MGAVCPAGWGTLALRQAVTGANQLPIQQLPGNTTAVQLKVRRVPAAVPRPAFASHTRLRRTSPIGQYAVAAALEAVGSDAPRIADGTVRLGIVYCAMAGCVNFSQRFYNETLDNPATASPMIFPETVFNAPASHLAALLGTRAINYTLIGDPGTVLQGLALGANWLTHDRVDACVVIGAEEMDRLVAHAARLFDRNAVISEGAGALYLRREAAESNAIELEFITDSHLFWTKPGRATAAAKARAQVDNNRSNDLLCDGIQGVARLDRDESAAWSDWAGRRLSPKRICGEAFTASAAWQCVAALDALSTGPEHGACVSVVGCNQQAIAARFRKTGPGT